MYFINETERLSIRILNSDDASKVLTFLRKNRQDFEPYESAKAPAYYTMDYQAANLHNEFTACLSKRYIRFYVFTRENPDEIIGTVSFSNIRETPYSDATIGYKFDRDYRNMGYAYEAVDCCLSFIFNELHLHRVDALIMPGNTASIKLARRLGFDYEGTARKLIKIGDVWEDHERYSLINPVL